MRKLALKRGKGSNVGSLCSKDCHIEKGTDSHWSGGIKWKLKGVLNNTTGKNSGNSRLVRCEVGHLLKQWARCDQGKAIRDVTGSGIPAVGGSLDQVTYSVILSLK